MNQIKRRRTHERDIAEAYPELVALHESLTAPDKEDWQVLVSGEHVFMTSLRQVDGDNRSLWFVTTAECVERWKMYAALAVETHGEA